MFLSFQWVRRRVAGRDLILRISIIPNSTSTLTPRTRVKECSTRRWSARVRCQGNRRAYRRTLNPQARSRGCPPATVVSTGTIPIDTTRITTRRDNTSLHHNCPRVARRPRCPSTPYHSLSYSRPFSWARPVTLATPVTSRRHGQRTPPRRAWLST